MQTDNCGRERRSHRRDNQILCVFTQCHSRKHIIFEENREKHLNSRRVGQIHSSIECHTRADLNKHEENNRRKRSTHHRSQSIEQIKVIASVPPPLVRWYILIVLSVRLLRRCKELIYWLRHHHHHHASLSPPGEPRTINTFMAVRFQFWCCFNWINLRVWSVYLNCCQSSLVATCLPLRLITMWFVWRIKCYSIDEIKRIDSVSDRWSHHQLS